MKKEYLIGAGLIWAAIVLTGKGGVLLIFAALYFWYRADNRKNIAFENEERRKEELHQAQLKKINKELEKED